jgi:hypothetical protein
MTADLLWTPARRGLLAARVPAEVAVSVLLLALYVALAWTPSSYGLALQAMGAPGAGLVAGHPQGLRSDEWAVWTPYLQALVNNGFQRFNATSVYGEDLRNFNALPIHDWGLLFKPQWWGFLLLEPARAFSLYHGGLIFGFVIGHWLLLRRFGFDRSSALLAALLLFLAACTQYWWTTMAPLLALFPWLLLACLIGDVRWRLPAVAYAAAVWLMGLAYPPVVISLAFAGAAALAAFRPAVLRPAYLAGLVMAAGLGAAVALLYFRDIVPVMAHTVYPGQRLVDGGSFPMVSWVSQFVPLLASAGLTPLLPINLLELSAASSLLPLSVLAFADWRRLAGIERRALRPLLVLVTAFLLISAWMLLPVPGWLVHPLGWDRVPPQRMVFAAGLVLVLAALELARRTGLVLSWTRLAVLAGLLAAAALWAGLRLAPPAIGVQAEDLVAVGAVAAATVAVRAGLPALPVLLVTAVAYNLWAFGSYNPIQSAVPLFERPATAVTAELDRQAAADPRGWLVAAAAPGAVLNGWGYRSVAHVLVAPQLVFFRAYFPGLTDGEFDTIFDRYAHVQLAAVTRPEVPQPDVIRIPKFVFQGGAAPAEPPTVHLGPVAADLPRVGNIDRVLVQGDTLVISGWAAMGAKAGRALRIAIDGLAARPEQVESVERPDVAAALHGRAYFGFNATLRLDHPPTEQLRSLCVAAIDPEAGTALLNDAPAGPACRPP